MTLCLLLQNVQHMLTWREKKLSHESKSRTGRWFRILRKSCKKIHAKNFPAEKWMNLSFFTFGNGFHIGVKFSVFCYPSKNAVRKNILGLIDAFCTLWGQWAQHKKKTLWKGQILSAFRIPMSMKMKRVGRATSVRSPRGTAASNLT